MTDKHTNHQLLQCTNGLRILFGKLHSLLISARSLKGDAIREACQYLESTTHDERVAYISETWGAVYADRTLPILQQIAAIEAEIARINDQT